MANNASHTKLTDAQRLILSSAAGRTDRLVELPNPAGSSRKIVVTLIRRGLLAEVPVRPNRPYLRRDEVGKPTGAKITTDGMAALRAGEPDIVDSTPPQTKGKHPAAKEANVRDPSVLPAIGRPATKQALIIALLQQAGGATLQDLMDATGWLPHTTRAALTGLRRKGLSLDRFKDPEDRTTYHLASDGATRRPAA